MQEEAVIYTLLVNDATVSSLVSQVSKEPPEPSITPLPYVMYSRNDTEINEITLGGSDRPHVIQFQVDTWANTPTSLHDTMAAVRNALDNQAGMIAGWDVQALKETGRDTVEDETTDKYNGVQTFILIA